MPELPEPAVEEVTDGVFAYLQLHGQWGLNNAAFITAADSVTLVDTCFTERRSRALADAVHRTAGDRPVRTLINTHHHGDHTHGNYVFGPGVTIVGHAKCREEVIATGLGTQALWPDVDWGEIVVTPPTVTFDERLTLYAGDLELQLIYVGPAHTTNDILVWLPERRTLIAGDVVFNGGTPFCVFGSLAGSLRALDTIRALAPERIVPGHGPVCGVEALDGIESYLRFVEETARKGHEAGVTPLDLARQTDLPDEFAALHDSERFVANLHRAYSELNGDPPGTPLPIPTVMPDMIAYNGGQMPQCLA
ncbi:MAG: MBL fold metallo-hydrolase [Chloroflexi bacterium]|nr:MBL fold metallo-hydrolase [Chloroflexota bacterium]